MKRTVLLGNIKAQYPNILGIFFNFFCLGAKKFWAQRAKSFCQKTHFVQHNFKHVSLRTVLKSRFLYRNIREQFFVHHNSKTLRSIPSNQKWVPKWEANVGWKNLAKISGYRVTDDPEQNSAFHDTWFSNNQWFNLESINLMGSIYSP